MREELQELQDDPSSPSTPSIMLSMGEDFMDKEERTHGVRQSQLPQDTHDSSSMLSSMLSMGEAALHFITSIEKDGNSSSTLSFSKCLYIYAFNHRCNLCISLPIITWLLGVQPRFIFVFNE